MVQRAFASFDSLVSKNSVIFTQVFLSRNRSLNWILQRQVEYINLLKTPTLISMSQDIIDDDFRGDVQDESDNENIGDGIGARDHYIDVG